MNLEYQINREVVYSLEYVKSEMELKMHQFRIQNPNADLSELQSKVDRIKKAQEYVYKSYEVIESVKKENQILKVANQKLQAEINATRNQDIL